MLDKSYYWEKFCVGDNDVSWLTLEASSSDAEWIIVTDVSMDIGPCRICIHYHSKTSSGGSLMNVRHRHWEVHIMKKCGWNITHLAFDVQIIVEG